MTQHNANNDKSAKRSLWNAASPSRGFVTRAASALMFVGAAALMFAFPGSASDDAAVAPGASGVVPQTFAEWREAGAPAPDDRWLAAEVGSFRLSRADDLSDRLIRAWQDRVRAEPERAVRQLHSRVLGENAIRHMFLDAAQNGEVGEVVDLDAAAWWKSYSEGYVVDIADSGIEAVLGYGEEQILAGAGFVRNVNLEYRSNLGGRQGQAAVEFLGPLRESARDAVVWQARGSFSEDSAPGANLGLIYRFAGDLPGSANRQALWGVNAFLDIQAEDEETFYRGSLGAEMRSGALDAYANFYLPLTDGVESGDDYVYTAEGFDFEVNFGVPGVDWASAVLGYYSWKGERGDDDQDGLRYGFRVRPPQGQLDVELELEYDQDQSDFGGRLAFSHVIGGDGPGAARSSFGGNFNPRDHFYDSVRREHAQRIRRVSAGVQVDNVYAAQGYNGVIANLTVTLAGENSYIHGVEVLAGGTVFVHSTTGGDSVGHDVIQLNLRSTRTIGEDQVNNPYRWDANITLAQGESRTTRRVAVDVYALAEAPPAETDMRFEISEAVANTDLITLSVPLPDNTRATVATFTKIGGHADLTVSDRGVVGATSDLPRSREAYTIVVAAEDETVASAVNRALGRQAETDLTGGKQFIGVFTITAEVQVGVISVGVASVTNGEVRAYYVGTDNEVNRIALEDDEIEYRAAPDAGYYVSGWTGTGQCSAAPVGDASESADIKTCGPITVSADLTVGANFAGGSYTVSYDSAPGDGTLQSPTDSGTVVPSGTEVVFTASPTSPGYYVGSWTNNGVEFQVPASAIGSIPDNTDLPDEAKVLTVTVTDHSRIAANFTPPIEVSANATAIDGYTGQVAVLNMLEVDGGSGTPLSGWEIVADGIEPDIGGNQFESALDLSGAMVTVDITVAVSGSHFFRAAVTMSNATTMTVRRIGVSVDVAVPVPAADGDRAFPNTVPQNTEVFTLTVTGVEGQTFALVGSANGDLELSGTDNNVVRVANSAGLVASDDVYRITVDASGGGLLGTQRFALSVAVGQLAVALSYTQPANGQIRAYFSGGSQDGTEITGSNFRILSGADVRFVADPADGYHITGWTGVCSTVSLSSDAADGTNQECTHTVTGVGDSLNVQLAVGANSAGRQLNVVFAATNPGDGNLTAASGGRSLNTGDTVPWDAQIVFTADPTTEDFGVGSWSGDCDGPGNVRSDVNDTATYTCTLSDIRDHVDVGVTFAPPKLVTIAVSFNEAERGEVMVQGGTDLGNNMWEVGAGPVVVQGAPYSAYHVGGWNGGCTGTTGAGYDQSTKTCTYADLQDGTGLTVTLLPGRLPEGIPETGDVGPAESDRTTIANYQAFCENFGGVHAESTFINACSGHNTDVGQSTGDCNYNSGSSDDCIISFNRARDCMATNTLPRAHASCEDDCMTFGGETIDNCTAGVCDEGYIVSGHPTNGAFCMDVSSRMVVFAASHTGGTLIVVSDGVTLSSGDTVPEGAEVIFTAIPEFGYSFTGWTDDCMNESDRRCVRKAPREMKSLGADPNFAEATGPLFNEIAPGIPRNGDVPLTPASCYQLGGEHDQGKLGPLLTNTCFGFFTAGSHVIGDPSCPLLSGAAADGTPLGTESCQTEFNHVRDCNKLNRRAGTSSQGSQAGETDNIFDPAPNGCGAVCPDGMQARGIYCQPVGDEPTDPCDDQGEALTEEGLCLSSSVATRSVSEAKSAYPVLTRASTRSSDLLAFAPPVGRAVPPNVELEGNVEDSAARCGHFGGSVTPLGLVDIPGFLTETVSLCSGVNLGGNVCLPGASRLACGVFFNLIRDCNALDLRAQTDATCEAEEAPAGSGTIVSCAPAACATMLDAGEIVAICQPDDTRSLCPPVVEDSGFAVAVAIDGVGELSTTVESGQVVLQVTPAEADYVMSWTGCHDGSDPANPTGGVSTTGNAGDSANTAQTCTISDIMGDVTATATTATRS